MKIFDQSPFFDDSMAMEAKNNTPIYEIGDDFSDVAAIGAIIIDPLAKRILLVRRLDEETEAKNLDKSKRNKVDSNGHIILALPSGSGTLKDSPDDPDEAVIKEIRSETGSNPTLLKRFHTYKKIGVPNARKVGFYIAEMNPDLVDCTDSHKDWPGWFPMEWFGNKIILPYAEHNQVVLDYLKEVAVVALEAA